MNNTMKHIIAAIALLAAAMPALAQTPTDRAREYRMWSAEQEIKHLVIRLGRMNAACKDVRFEAYAPKASEACGKAVMDLYPKLKIIREVAASGDVVQWANVMDLIRTLERETEPALQALRK